MDTTANRRAVGVLNWLIRLCREVLDHQPDQASTVRCRLWLNRAQTLQRRPLVQTLLAAAAITGAGRQAEEATEARYRISYEVARDLRRRFGWTAQVNPMPRFSYVERADVIYQAYAASCLARSLGLTQTDIVLGRRPLAFSGPQFDLYYDTTPPSDVLRSWRSVSDRPDVSRPDLLLHERDTGRVALLDAKYRVGPDGGASEDSRKDVTAYLGLYGLNGISIIYPGSASVPSTVSGQGRTIVELPLIPSHPDISTAVPLVLATLEQPPF